MQSKVICRTDVSPRGISYKSNNKKLLSVLLWQVPIFVFAAVHNNSKTQRNYSRYANCTASITRGTHFVQLLRVYCFNRPGEHYIVDVENDRNANRSIINIILLSVKWRIKLLAADEFPSNKVASLYIGSLLASAILHVFFGCPMLRVLCCK